ncbi:MAG: ImmA/IrrE family metallo-endopeptidase [Akkermansiaceae bacterium]|nr:ImmA/IrrE family metallo-endopeptidase [Akkermansiaceae bacterium]
MPHSNDILDKLNNAHTLPLVHRHYSEQELESMPITQLKKFDLYPNKPEPVDIESLADSISDHVDYCNLPDNLMGATQFIYGAKPIILLNNKHFTDADVASTRRSLFTIGHECGHIIMQDALFQLACERNIRRKTNSASALPNYRPLFHQNSAKCDWREWQANTAAAHLLMPPEHVHSVIQNVLKNNRYDAESRNLMHCNYILEAINFSLSEIFNVSYTAAKITCERYLKKFSHIFSNLLAAIKVTSNR